MNVFIEFPLNPPHKARIVEIAGPACNIIVRGDLTEKEDIEKAICSADIIFGNLKPDLLQLASSAKWVQLSSTGFEQYSSVSIGATVTNMHDFYAEPCAETMIAGILAIYRKTNELSVHKEKKVWVGSAVRPRLQLLKNKRVVILGAGSIGRCVERILKGFEAEVILFSRTATDAILHTTADLVEKVSWADIIVGCLPGTTETKGLFTREMISRMKSTALFCNVGRGNLLEDESFLVDALMNGSIGGAVLDVTEVEPIPPSHALWDCPNTILSQHSGGGQPDESEGIVGLFLENFQRLQRREPLINEVTIGRGY